MFVLAYIHVSFEASRIFLPRLFHTVDFSSYLDYFDWVTAAVIRSPLTYGLVRWQDIPDTGVAQ